MGKLFVVDFPGPQPYNLVNLQQLLVFMFFYGCGQMAVARAPWGSLIKSSLRQSSQEQADALSPSPEAAASVVNGHFHGERLPVHLLQPCKPSEWQSRATPKGKIGLWLLLSKSDSFHFWRAPGPQARCARLDRPCMSGWRPLQSWSKWAISRLIAGNMYFALI